MVLKLCQQLNNDRVSDTPHTPHLVLSSRWGHSRPNNPYGIPKTSIMKAFEFWQKFMSGQP